MASPLGQYCLAIVWLITARAAPRAISSRFQRRPCATGMRRSGKYSGLTKLTRATGFSSALLPRISNGAVASVRRRRRVGRDACRYDLRHRGDRRSEPLEVLGTLLPRLVGTVVDGDRQRHRVLRVVSEIRVRQSQESLSCRARRGQHQERQRDLDRDHHTMGPPALRAADHPSSAGLRHPAEVGARELERPARRRTRLRSRRPGAVLNNRTGMFISITDSAANELVGSQATISASPFQPIDTPSTAPMHGDRQRLRQQLLHDSDCARRQEPRARRAPVADARRAPAAGSTRWRSRRAAGTSRRRAADTASAPSAARTSR